MRLKNYDCSDIHVSCLSISLILIHLLTQIKQSILAASLHYPDGFTWYGHATYYFGRFRAFTMLMEMLVGSLNWKGSCLFIISMILTGKFFSRTESTRFKRSKSKWNISKGLFWSHFLADIALLFSLADFMMYTQFGQPLTISVLNLTTNNFSYIFKNGILTTLPTMFPQLFGLFSTITIFHTIPFYISHYHTKFYQEKNWIIRIAFFRRMIHFISLSLIFCTFTYGSKVSNTDNNQSLVQNYENYLKIDNSNNNIIIYDDEPCSSTEFLPLQIHSNSTKEFTKNKKEENNNNNNNIIHPDLIFVFWENVRADVALSSYTTPYLYSLLKSTNHTFYFDSAHESIPNTKKSIIEIICGIEPQLTSSWDDLDLIQESFCLPKVLKSVGNYVSLYFSVSGSKSFGDIGNKLGFDEVYSSERLQEELGLDKPEISDCVAEIDVIDHLSTIVQRIKIKNPNKPLFLAIKTCACHAPYKIPKAQSKTNSITFNDLSQPSPLIPGKVPYEYFNSVYYTDVFFKNLFPKLFKSLNSLPFVIFAADHGEAFGQHVHRYHGSCVFDECTRVPLLMSGVPNQFLSKLPECVKNKNKGLRRLVDIFPTFLEVSNSLDKVTLSSLQTGKSLLSSCGHEYVHTHSFLNTKTFSTHHQDFIAVFDVHLSTFLYNLKTDPYEQFPQSLEKTEIPWQQMYQNGIKKFRQNLCTYESFRRNYKPKE